MMEESIKITVPNMFEIASWLITLLGIKRSEVARATKNNPANLSQWLQGRDKLLSSARQEAVLEWLGLVNGKLDASRLHRWEVSNDFSALRGVLTATETAATLLSLTVHKVDGNRSHDARSPVLVEFEHAGATVIILAKRPASAGKHPLTLDAGNLGFGRNGPDLQFPQDLLDGHNEETTSTELLKFLITPYSENVYPQTELPLTKRQAEIIPPDQLLSDKERTITALRNDVADLRCHEVGLRAVIRESLKAIRQLAPEHPLLDEKNRKRIYEEYILEEVKKKN